MNYQEILEQYRQKERQIEIDGNPFLVRQLNGGESEYHKTLGFEVNLDDDNKPDMSVNKLEYTRRRAYVVHKCLLSLDSEPICATLEEAEALPKTFFDKAYEAISEHVDVQGETVEEAEKN